MKIERPAIIQTFHTELCYSAGQFDIKSIPPEEMRYMSDQCAALGGPTGLCNLVKLQTALVKAYYHVAADLSRDMELCTFDGEFRREYFPSEAGVFRWQDPSLPAVGYSIGKTSNGEDGAIFVLDSKEEWGTVHTQSHCFSFPFDLWESVLGNTKLPCLKSAIPELDKELTDEENEGMIYMVSLISKVLMFAAIDHERVVSQPMTTRNDKKAVGIHPKHDFYTTVKSIRYLPHVRTERDAQESAAKADAVTRKHTFKGRVGYLRTYQHERYKMMRGKTQYIWPLPAPEGYEVVYKIRKPV